MTVESVARAHQRRQSLLVRSIVEALLALWAQVDAGDIDGSWIPLLERAAQLLAAGQYSAAGTATTYVRDMAATQDLAPDLVGVTDARAFAGVAADGRSLTSLLSLAGIYAKAGIANGLDLPAAMTRGGAFLALMGGNEVAQAGRNADQVAMTSSRTMTGYVRMLVPPSCNRCVVLAGKWFHWNQGFARHPQCFPAGTVVSGPATRAATRRWYEGELVVLTTASGEQLSLTGNHPVLTRRGWVPAHLLREGDDVLRSTRPEGAAALVVPDHHQVPALVEDVWRSLGMAGLDRVPSSAEDFHGDGQQGDVDVVYADGALRDRRELGLLSVADPVRERHLARRVGNSGQFDVERASMLLDLRHAAQAGGAVRGRGLALALVGAHPGVTGEPGLAHAAALDSRFGQDAGDGSSAHVVLLREAVLAGTGEVGRDDLLLGQHPVAPRWDAPGGPLTVETADGYAGRGRDLLDRLAGQVEADRLVEVRRVEWSGHVYSLTSAEGWHSANSLIVSNCDCVHVPAAESRGVVDVRTSPRGYFDSLTKHAQDATFGGADAQAIRDGGDISRVVNLSTRPARRRAGLVEFDLGDGTDTAGARPSISDIYHLAGDSRTRATALLTRHGYLTTT